MEIKVKRVPVSCTLEQAIHDSEHRLVPLTPWYQCCISRNEFALLTSHFNFHSSATGTQHNIEFGGRGGTQWTTHPTSIDELHAMYLFHFYFHHRSHANSKTLAPNTTTAKNVTKQRIGCMYACRHMMYAVNVCHSRVLEVCL